MQRKPYRCCRPPIETEAGERLGWTCTLAATPATCRRGVPPLPSRGKDDVDATFSLALRVNGTTVPTLPDARGKGGARGRGPTSAVLPAVQASAADWGAPAGCKTGDEPSAV